MNPTDTVIDVHSLVKRFGQRTAVDGLSLTVRRGEIFGFLGPNGSGKTTSIRMLCGLLTPDAGSGTCLGYNVLNEAYAIKRHVGYMTQRFSLYEDLTLRENLEFVARVFNVRSLRSAVAQCLQQLSLTDRQHQLAGALSGGWKQRLALAACMLHSPQLLLLDEPTAGVDPRARREFWDEVHRLAANGITVLVSTHYMDEAERCHRLAFITQGKLLTQGTVSEVIAESGLLTWIGSGPDLASIASDLRVLPGVEQVVPFGNHLHVSGSDAVRLHSAVAKFDDHPLRTWRKAEPSLEDVFIAFMNRSLEMPPGAGRNRVAIEH